MKFLRVKERGFGRLTGNPRRVVPAAAGTSCVGFVKGRSIVVGEP